MVYPGKITLRQISFSFLKIPVKNKFPAFFFKNEIYFYEFV